jgi:D-alanyl-D-alanine dipeptidase
MQQKAQGVFCASLVPLAAVLIVTLWANAAAQSELPKDFVFLRDVEPSIMQDIRYAGHDNFLGRPVKGYDNAECILTRNAAAALRKAQNRVQPKYSLKVFDCYRPARATMEFVAWTNDPNDEEAKEKYYSTINKRRLFAEGFIARRSRHNQGVAVDVTLIDQTLGAPAWLGTNMSAPCFLAFSRRAAETNLDFGTAFDCFHEMSATRHPRVSNDAKRNRKTLLHAMESAGFRNYGKEWWHFELPTTPAAAEYDFSIPPYDTARN